MNNPYFSQYSPAFMDRVTEGLVRPTHLPATGVTDTIHESIQPFVIGDLTEPMDTIRSLLLEADITFDRSVEVGSLIRNEPHGLPSELPEAYTAYKEAALKVLGQIGIQLTPQDLSLLHLYWQSVRPNEFAGDGDGIWHVDRGHQLLVTSSDEPVSPIATEWASGTLSKPKWYGNSGDDEQIYTSLVIDTELTKSKNDLTITQFPSGALIFDPLDMTAAGITRERYHRLPLNLTDRTQQRLFGHIRFYGPYLSSDQTSKTLELDAQYRASFNLPELQA